MKRIGVVVLAVIGLGLCGVGCDDEAGSKGSGEGLPDGGQGGGDASEEVGEPEAAPEPEASPEPEATPEPEPPPECREPGRRRCVGPGTLEECLQNGRLSTRECEEGEVCQALGGCVPDPQGCQRGQRICLDDDLPAECELGSAWRPLAACEQGEACLEGECRGLRCAQAAATSSYLGCDYLATDLPNLAWAPFGGTPSSPLGVVLANPSEQEPVAFSVYEPVGRALAELVSEVTIEPPFIVGGQHAPVTVQSEVLDRDGLVVSARVTRADHLEIPPGGMAVVLLPHHGYLERTSIVPTAWHIQTDAPVAAYQFGPYCCNFSFSNDASLLFPISTWGKDYGYLGVPAWAQAGGDEDPGSNIPTAMTLIGAYNDTRVEIALKPGVSVVPDAAGRVVVQGQTVRATLQAREVLHLFTDRVNVERFPLTGTDLSGTRITSSQPVAVFSGHPCSFYPQTQGACDHLEEQLFPTETWGQEFALVPPILRTRAPQSATEAIYWKILARDADTEIRLSAPMANLNPIGPGFEGVPDCRDRMTDASTILLGQDEYCEFGTRAPVFVRASGPLMVMGIISGQDTTGFSGAFFGNHAGDPAIFLVPPARQYRDRYTFLATTTYFNDYLTVITSSAARVELDGVMVDMSGAAGIPGTDQVFKHITIEDGAHEVVSSHPLGILVYAYDDYVSYAFTGGLNLIKRGAQ